MKGNCTLELDVDSVALNNAMSKAVSDAVKSLNIEQIVNVAKEFDANIIVSLLDIEELKTMVAEKISQKIISKMGI